MKIQKRTILLGVLGIGLLIVGARIGMGKKSDPVVEKERTPFTIQTLALGSSTGETIIRKTGKVIGSSQITLSALTAGRIQRLPVDVGARVNAGTLVASLIDTQGSTVFRAQNAGLAIQSAQNTYEVQKKNLEKQIADLQIAQQRAALDFSTVASVSGGTASLQIAGLEKSLEKAKFDYDTKVKSDAVTIANYVVTAKNVYSDTLNLMIDVIDQADDIVHVRDQQLRTQQYIYFAGKSDALKNQAENELRELIGKKIQLEQKGNAITDTNMQDYLTTYRSYCEDINQFVTTMKEALTQSIIDTRYLSESMLAGYTTAFGGMQSKASGIVASITAQVNGLQSFLTTYKDQQQSLATQIAILENDVVVKKNQLDQVSQNSAMSLESTNNNVDFATQTKDMNLQSLQNALRQAQLALDEANFNAAKLAVRAPIVGEISSVLVDVGQEVSIGTPLLTMVSEGKEVEVTLAQNELEGLQMGAKILLEDDYGAGEGVIVSIGSVAEKSGNFPIKVRITRGDFAIGGFVRVLLGAQRSGLLVPINAVTVVDNGVGQIVLWDGSELETMLVTLGETFGTVVEIKDAIPSHKKLVVSDSRNYDPQTMTIVAK